MKVKTKIWLGVGAFVLAGSGATRPAPFPRSLLKQRPA